MVELNKTRPNFGQSRQLLSLLTPLKQQLHEHRKALNRKLKEIERLINSLDKTLEYHISAVEYEDKLRVKS